MEQPYQHAIYFVTYLTQEVLWTPAEKLQALEPLHAEDLEAYFPKMLQQLYVEGLVHGNVDARVSDSWWWPECGVCHLSLHMCGCR
jgi:insulysin